MILREQIRASGVVTAVSRSASHSFGKANADVIMLVAGLGVAGDAHLGVTVQHRSRVLKNPDQPNLRQVHLVHAELHDALRANGFVVAPGAMGENVTTQGIDLLALPCGTLLRLGDAAVVEITGLRNPCVQLDGLQFGLMRAVIGRDRNGAMVRKAGVMGVVVTGGEVRPGDPITVTLPAEPYERLAPV